MPEAVPLVIVAADEHDELNKQPDLVIANHSLANGWLQLVYQTTLYRSAARPVICFEGGDMVLREAMSAAPFGQSEWIGRIPGEVDRVRVDLPRGFSRHDFGLVSGRVLSYRELMALARGRNAPKALLAALLHAAGDKTASYEVLRSLFGATRLRRYHEWRSRDERPLDPQGMDRLRKSWDRGPHIRVILLGGGETDPDAVASTVASLERQSYSNWSLALNDKSTAIHSRRFIRIDDDAKAEALWSGLAASDVIMPVTAGDMISDYAMGALVEFAGTPPAHDLCYADEDSIDAGRYVAPLFKPDWSPIFLEARPFIGRAIYARRRALDRHGRRSRSEMLSLSAWQALFGAAEGPVGHIRRVLLTKIWEAPGPETRHAAARAAASDATATVIIPTRDRAGLMAACLASLEKTMPRTFDLLIVDNGSKDWAARQLLHRAARFPGVRVLGAEGPFNFSALCNRAAGQADGRVLVFLNNDTEAMRPDWLRHLVAWAVRPDVGAVGAKLLYPSGRLQHAGLVLGLGGYAAHIDIGVPGADAGYLDRHTVPHEVSAVTGACLAVEKRKFDAIGGFDAEKYPVELGDVDLCLRLSRRGWKTVFTPDAVLKHKESATRGRGDVAKRYAAERRHFLAAWGDEVLDDPFFHPALSLTARRTSLDH